MCYALHRNLNYLSDNCNLHIFWDAISQKVVDFGPFHYSYIAFTPLNGPLWFIRDLIVITLLSPVLYNMIKWSKGIFIILLAFLFCFNIGYPICGISFSSLFFFSLGAYFAIMNKSFVAFVKNNSTLICTLAIVSLLMAIYYDGMNTKIGLYIYPIFVTLNTFSFFVFANRLLKYERLVSASIKMKKHVFFIYASHVGLYIVTIIGVVFTKVINDSSTDSMLILRYIGIIVSVSFVCILLSIIMSRIMPKTYKVITGSR